MAVCTLHIVNALMSMEIIIHDYLPFVIHFRTWRHLCSRGTPKRKPFLSNMCDRIIDPNGDAILTLIPQQSPSYLCENRLNVGDYQGDRASPASSNDLHDTFRTGIRRQGCDVPCVLKAPYSRIAWFQGDDDWEVARGNSKGQLILIDFRGYRS